MVGSHDNRKTNAKLTYLHGEHIAILFGRKQYRFHIIQRALEVVKVRLAAAQFLAKGSTKLMVFILLALNLLELVCFLIVR